MFRFKTLILAAASAATIALSTFAGTNTVFADGNSAGPVRGNAAVTATLDTTNLPRGSVLTVPGSYAVDSFFDIFFSTGDTTVTGPNGSRATANGRVEEPSCLVADDATEATKVKEYKQTKEKGKQAEWLKKLKKAVIETGVPDMVWVEDTYDCDDFAGDLETKLTALGYDATFTVYWCKKADGTYFAHAITDVHANDGTVTWIEPQTGEVVDLDFDGDGVVEVATTHGDYRTATDGSCRIEFYDSRAAAEKAGVIMD